MGWRGYVETLAAALEARHAYGQRAKRSDDEPALASWVADVTGILERFPKRERLALAVLASLVVGGRQARARLRLYSERGDQVQAGKAAVEVARAERGMRRMRHRAWVMRAIRQADVEALKLGLLRPGRVGPAETLARGMPEMGNTEGGAGSAGTALARRTRKGRNTERRAKGKSSTEGHGGTGSRAGEGEAGGE